MCLFFPSRHQNSLKTTGITTFSSTKGVLSALHSISITGAISSIPPPTSTLHPLSIPLHRSTLLLLFLLLLIHSYCLICFAHLLLLPFCSDSVGSLLLSVLSCPRPLGSPALRLLPRLPDREGSRVPVRVCVCVGGEGKRDLFSFLLFFPFKTILKMFNQIFLLWMQQLVVTC